MDMQRSPGIRIALVLLAAGWLQAGCTQAQPEPLPAAPIAAAAGSSDQMVAASANASTNADQVSPGEYATEGGWGRLSIDATTGDGIQFSLESENAGDGCSLSGSLQGRRATVHEGGKATQCVLELTPGAHGLAVGTSSAEACDAWCGSNGSYQGEYLRLTAACAADAVEAARARFKQLYDRKAFAEADQALAPVYRECLPTLAMIDEGGVRNDYALNRHKLKDDAGCVAALGKYRADAARSDEDITESMAPGVAEDFLAVVRAARTNLALCMHRKDR